MVKEAILIVKKASLNSKSEYKGYKIARISVEKSERDRKEEEVREEALETQVRQEMIGLKDRVEKANAQLKANNNQVFLILQKKTRY